MRLFQLGAAGVLLILPLALMAVGNPPEARPVDYQVIQGELRFGPARQQKEGVIATLSSGGEYYVLQGRPDSAPETKWGLDVCVAGSGHSVFQLALPRMPDRYPTASGLLPTKSLLAVGLSDGSILLWNFLTSEKVAEFRVGSRNPVSAIAITRDGKTVLATTGDVVTFWSLPAGEERQRVKLPGQQTGLLELASPDAFAVCDSTGNICLVDGANGRVKKRLNLFEQRAPERVGGSPVSLVARSNDGKRLAVQGGAGEVVLVDLQQEKVIRRFVPPERGFHQMAFTPDSTTLVSLGIDRTMRRWDATTGDEQATFGPRFANPGPSPDLTFSADGKHLVTLTTRVRRWDLESGREQLQPEPHGHSLSAIAHSRAAGLVATASSDGAVCIWDARTGVHRGTLRAGRQRISSVAFLGDGKRLAVGGSDSLIRIWAGGEVVANLEGHIGVVLSLAATPDGKSLVSGGQDWTLRMWDTATGKVTRTQTTNALVREVAISADGRLVAALVHGRRN